MLKKFLKNILESVASRKIGVDEAVSSLLNEMGRGGAVLVMDERYYHLGQLLADKNYSVRDVISGSPDEEIKKQIASKVFITHNGKHFSNRKDMEKYKYGLIWVTSNEDEQILAKKIEKVLMTHNFNSNRIQLVKITKRKRNRNE